MPRSKSADAVSTASVPIPVPHLPNTVHHVKISREEILSIPIYLLIAAALGCVDVNRSVVHDPIMIQDVGNDLLLIRSRLPIQNVFIVRGSRAIMWTQERSYDARAVVAHFRQPVFDVEIEIEFDSEFMWDRRLVWLTRYRGR